MVREVDALVRRAIEVRERLEETEVGLSRLRGEYEDHRERVRRIGQCLTTRRLRWPNDPYSPARLAEQCVRVIHRRPG